MAAEAKLQAKIIKWLTANDFYWFKVITATKNGIVDINGCTPHGRFYSIEVKIKPNKVTALQQFNLDAVNDRGGIAFAAFDFDTVVKTLSKYKYKL